MLSFVPAHAEADPCSVVCRAQQCLDTFGRDPIALVECLGDLMGYSCISFVKRAWSISTPSLDNVMKGQIAVFGYGTEFHAQISPYGPREPVLTGDVPGYGILEVTLLNGGQC